ncbi:hypothetical protein PTTG_27948 [Puccinia triticina 1-1 BBBD Race 1]|uniref:Uncharacterized protein n=2 Tax=Puccinia triticina TaxID=208348 RepID=A0A180GFS1_PUCT1|nr:hypothetical protein PTTG_27948 [Puccinia triticina 1-1 BBBD Race 1]WAR63750.1 hypothetical protein PtB15_17B351 [Puccinia triticina]
MARGENVQRAPQPKMGRSQRGRIHEGHGLSKYKVTPATVGGAETVKQGTYERDPATGKFRDEDIARILRDATYDVAGAFGAQHSPAVLRWIDCQGMRTARDVWRACTLNEFREYLGLKAFESFEEWNSDETIANTMEDLVGRQR